MFNKAKITAIVLSAGVAFSSVAQADNEVSLERLVSSMMAQTVNATKQELSYSVQEAVLTAGNMFSLEDEHQGFASKVTITDLDSETEKEVKKQAE